MNNNEIQGSAIHPGPDAAAPIRFSRRTVAAAVAACLYAGMVPARSQGLLAAAGADTTEPGIAPEDAQAQLALVKRLLATLARLGEPLDVTALNEFASLEAAGRLGDAVASAHRVLSGRVLFGATINPEGQVSLHPGAAPAVLVQGGWRLFLARIDNPTLVPGRFVATSAESVPVNGLNPPQQANGTAIGPGAPVPTNAGDVAARWLDLLVFDTAELPAELLPLPVDFKILQLSARDAGRHTARVRVQVGAGRSDVGEHDALTIPFQVLPAQVVRFAVRDTDGSPVTCSWLIVDSLGRIYPSQARRLPPDLYFQQKIYRADAEMLALPAGEYTVETGRGPEYLRESSVRRVGSQGESRWEVTLRRWIDPRLRGWYSGDHHIHAAGCSHYMQPTEGVGPEIMARQVRGEALSIGAVLTWGPGFYTQKLHFSGRDDPESGRHERLRYDLEVSGFPSSHCGHTVLLQMQGMDYPGTERIEQWPSSNAPILRWAKEQGAITGYAHSGWGLIVATTDLPNEMMPAFDGIGANDYIVTAPAGLVDFISVCDTPDTAELNIWYHTLNVGLRTRIAGETDWPCIFDERVGMGRSYVQIKGALSYEAWCQGIKQGRCYVSDGRAHLMGFVASTDSARASLGGADLVLAKSAPVTIEVDVAARLEPTPTATTSSIRALGAEDKPYWHLERARLGDSRRVAVELIVDGSPVETRVIEADGEIRRMVFRYVPLTSCWVAVRIRGSAHTNPIWITVGDAPICTHRSAQWCRAAVEQCWRQKSLRIRESERPAEAALYDAARAHYDRLIAESTP